MSIALSHRERLGSKPSHVTDIKSKFMLFDEIFTFCFHFHPMKEGH
jgi:hypothetical protein